MLKSLLFVGLVATSGCSMCSEDKSSSTATTETTASGASGAGGSKRSSKIDLGRRPGNRPSVGTPTTPGDGSDGMSAADRRDEWRAKVDTDGDGVISEAERQAARAERVAERERQLDADGDGKVSDEERAKARAERASEMRARIDGDGDGKVSADELAASSFGRFGMTDIDADRNGDISSEELATALKARNEQRRKLLPGGRRMGRDLRDGAAGSGSAK